MKKYMLLCVLLISSSVIAMEVDEIRKNVSSNNEDIKEDILKELKDAVKSGFKEKVKLLLEDIENMNKKEIYLYNFDKVASSLKEVLSALVDDWCRARYQEEVYGYSEKLNSSCFGEIVKLLWEYIEKNKIVIDSFTMGHILEKVVRRSFKEELAFLLAYIEKNKIDVSESMGDVLFGAVAEGSVEALKLLLVYIEKSKIAISSCVLAEVLEVAVDRSVEAVKLLLAHMEKNKIIINTLYMEKTVSKAAKKGFGGFVVLILAHITKLYSPDEIKKVLTGLLNNLNLKPWLKRDIEAYKKIYPVLIGEQSVKDYRNKNQMPPDYEYMGNLEDQKFQDLQELFYWAILADDTKLVNQLLNIDELGNNSEYPLGGWFEFAVENNAEKSSEVLLQAILKQMRRPQKNQENEQNLREQENKQEQARLLELVIRYDMVSAVRILLSLIISQWLTGGISHENIVKNIAKLVKKAEAVGSENVVRLLKEWCQNWEVLVRQVQEPRENKSVIEEKKELNMNKEKERTLKRLQELPQELVIKILQFLPENNTEMI